MSPGTGRATRSAVIALVRQTVLAVRFALGGGREQAARTVVTAVGSGLGVCLLLLAASVFTAISAHETRDAWMATSGTPGAGASLLWRARSDGYAGREIERVDVAPLGARPALPPGLTSLPGPGELAVSPALRRLLETTPQERLGRRYPGRIVATVGDAALRSPDSLVVFVGHDPARLAAEPDVVRVAKIGTTPQSVSLTQLGRVAAGLGAAALLVPILVLIGSATRLAAARREQRLAAMRLAGATPGQVRGVAVAEGLLGALLGMVLGFAGFALVRPYAAGFPIDGATFFPDDLKPAWWAVALVAAGVPVLVTGAALLALRRVRVSPLGVARQADPGRQRLWRIVPLAVALVAFAASMPALAQATGAAAQWFIAAVVGAIILGIVVAGPWLAFMAGRLLIAASRHPSTLLAGHRLTHNPAAGFRSISGVVLVTIVAEAGAGALAQHPAPGRQPIPAGAVAVIGHQALPLPGDALVTRLRAIPGVTGVLDLHAGGGATVVARCADLRATGMASCPDPAAAVALDTSRLANGELRSAEQTTVHLDPGRLPLLGLLVTTNGDRAVMETCRTAIETTTGAAWLPWTTDELKGRSSTSADQMTRISDLALLVTLLIAGLNLAVTAAGGLLERRRPFALLRLAGMRPGELRRVLLAETAGPLLITAAASAVLGLAVSAEVTHVSGLPWRPPLPAYWWILTGGLSTALVIALTASLPLLGKLTSLETARFE
ncbi:hypothetical protein J5X84_38175 [Streptosporangiaceae bacterium NEAU-GS5]|nr:hypothetical protein [Streptosporangiaceae bacterium NEAU-GS5]